MTIVFCKLYVKKPFSSRLGQVAVKASLNLGQSDIKTSIKITQIKSNNSYETYAYVSLTISLKLTQSKRK